jgi:hypothetical protein
MVDGCRLKERSKGLAWDPGAARSRARDAGTSYPL